ncbi:CUE domain-containing protein 2 [Protopterus annectens]|uniref:CUE domain-containing protein 2 n=1 Tax=Protopterus annectens TaxID=7888 RepID=UPI001CF9C2E7|nr:CUE domain-containing protein 2 [Protopterus annectens]
MELEKIIRDTLSDFIHFHIPNADLSIVDDVVLSYFTGVMEDLGSPESTEENFDIESFVEMMEAYIPGFAEISSVKVFEMIFELAEKLSEARNKGKHCNGYFTLLAKLTSSIITEEFTDAEPQIQLLLEMFPSCSVSEVKRVLHTTKGNLEETVHLIMEGEENRSTYLPEVLSINLASCKPQHEDLKKTILNKYMLVECDKDEKFHRPVAPKEVPKKLIRYIDNQVVSTKGERYKEIKKPESEEMKKTYVNLKPARKYRFH